MNMPGSDPMARWLEDVWLGRYLDRELKDDEHAWFEAYMLDKPHLLEQVDADTRLRETLQRATDADLRHDTAESQHARVRPGAKSRGPVLAIAASLLVGLGLGAMLTNPGEDESTLIASPPRIVFDTLRGEGTATLSEAGSASSKLLIVDIATPTASPIISAGAWIDGKRTLLPTPVVSSEGFVTFLVPANWQHRARIELEIGDPDQSRKLSFQL